MNPAKQSAGRCAGLISNRRFCLRRRNLKRWEKPLCFRTGFIQASKSFSIFSVRTALHRRHFFQIHSCRFGAPAVVWEESPPVILLCAFSFLLNHDDMILTCAFFPEIAGGLFYLNGRNQCASEPDASKPAKALQSSRYALPSTVTRFF